MRETEYRVVHGWVEDIEKSRAAVSEYRLLMKLEEGRLLEFAMGQPGSSLKLGDEVSIAVDCGRPGQVLALVDHSTGEGTWFCGGAGNHCVSEVDWLVIAALAGSFVVGLEWISVPTLAAFVVAYWLLRRSIQQEDRRREAARIAYLLDRDYCRWRAAFDRRGGAG